MFVGNFCIFTIIFIKWILNHFVFTDNSFIVHYLQLIVERKHNDWMWIGDTHPDLKRKATNTTKIKIVVEFYEIVNKKQVQTMAQQTEVGVQDFVLLDEITLERFMENLHKRWVIFFKNYSKLDFSTARWIFLDDEMCVNALDFRRSPSCVSYFGVKEYTGPLISGCDTHSIFKIGGKRYVNAIAKPHTIRRFVCKYEWIPQNKLNEALSINSMLCYNTSTVHGN